MSARLASLDQIGAAVWSELSAATAGRGHEWREAVLATTDGALADARTVVLREAEPESRILRFYTDERAAKVHQFARHPVGTIVCWSRALGWQLRCRVSLTVQVSGLAVSSRWARIRLTPAAQDYLSPLPPGTPVGTVDDPTAPVRSTSVERAAFAVVDAQVLSIDWLELHAAGHRRARFDDAGARWLQP
jgi:hypothetical protein